MTENFGEIIDIVKDLSDSRSIENVKTAPEFEKNPFMENFTLRKKKYYEKSDKVSITVGKTEVSNKDFKNDEVVLATKLYKDTEPFSRIFLTADIDIIKMKGITCKLLLYIAYSKLNVNVDWIIINPNSLCKHFSISLPTMNSAILELIQEGIIAKKNEENIYWFNPHVVFRGDRKKIKYSNG